MMLVFFVGLWLVMMSDDGDDGACIACFQARVYLSV